MSRSRYLVVILFLVGGLTACIRDNRTRPQEGKATLLWSANSEDHLAGYKIHFGTRPGIYTVTFDVGLTDSPSSPSITVRGLTTRTTYYFVVSTYNAKGIESAYSLEVSKFIE